MFHMLMTLQDKKLLAQLPVLFQIPTMIMVLLSTCLEKTTSLSLVPISHMS
jgi:hypothetical protein